MNISPCGKYVIHPVRKMLVKIEDGDMDAAGGFESVHCQVVLKALERIDKNKNSMLRSRLYAMRKGRDLRDIKRMTEYVHKVVSDLSNKVEYNELSDIYGDMHDELSDLFRLSQIPLFLC
ncbi:hypothetical protein O3P69_010237 [Scylla paramamosain]|uniref:Uncharacterized protein n=1 Tax=Scylla paramamosain TaxID=85552 RepID=A0AAW0TUQ0_SCYPA